uniref:Uncharacterized protein n=1 Tax=Branchiostoma floridae TaxID=7739 RepID=C3ZTB9_BRAFL|eukprot:XP_002588155.1 hypothetical protein BRAFLDRAFT_68793 [Branchiostoma floridae]
MATSTGTCKSKLKQGVAEDWASVGRAYGLNSDTIKVLIYCKPYIVALNAGALDFDETGDELFDFVGEAMEMMDAGNYKGALLLLPEQTFLPRYLAETLQQKGQIFTLRHTDGFVSVVREEVDKLLEDEEEEDEDEEHDETLTSTPRGQAYLLEVSPGELVLITGDEDLRAYGLDKEDPTRTPQTESGVSGARSKPKVNRKLYPELPTQDGSQDTISTGSSEGRRETEPKKKEATRDVRPKDQTPQASLSSRHPKKDPTPDGRRSKEASKASSGSATTALASSGIHVKKDGTPDMRYKENKMAAGLYGLKKDGTPDGRFKQSDSEGYDSVLAHTTPTKTASSPFQRDTWEDGRPSPPSSPYVSKENDGYVYGGGLSTSGFTGRYPVGPLKKDGTPDMRYKVNKMAAGLYGLKMDGTPDMRFKEHKIAAGLYGLKKDGTPDRRFKESKQTYDSVLDDYTTPRVTEIASSLFQQDTLADERSSPPSSPYVSKENDGYGGGLSTSGFTGRYPVGPLKKDGTPDMRYKVNKMAAGLYGLQMDGSPDMRFKANKIAAGLYGLKKDGTPDMRFKENRTSYGPSSYSPCYSSGYSSGYSPSYSSGYSPSYSSGYSPSYSSGYSPSYSPCYSAGPLKKNGTPDMRYKANKIACGMYGYKMNGTPDRRFKANRRR